MQIDTHNREHNATEVTGYRPSFLPKSIDGRDGSISGENLRSGLSLLIECPCSDRIYRSKKNFSAVLTGGGCKSSIASEADCAAAVALVADISSSFTTHNASMAAGCTMRPSKGTYVAVFNSFKRSKAQCGTKGATAKGPFTWGAPINGTMINCGDFTAGSPCPAATAAAGCGKNETGIATQCVWKSFAAAKTGCAKMDNCGAFFSSARFELPKLSACPKGKACPLLFFARSEAAGSELAKSPSDTVYPKHYIQPAPADYLEGSSLEALQGPSLVNVTLSHDGVNATITLVGPAAQWFGVGWGAQNMAALPYAITVSGGQGKVTERKLGPHRPGSVLEASVLVKANTVADGLRTVVLSRAVWGKSKDHYNFPTEPGSIDLITAVGNGAEFAYHKARTGAKLTLLPTKVDSCMCAPVTTEYLSYMNTSTAEFHYTCAEEPRGDMAHGQRDVDGKLLHNGKLMNPACQMETYHGGLRCCHHEWFLTDLEQNASIPLDQPNKNRDGLIPGIQSVDTYYLKWRFHFQEFKPAPEQPQLTPVAAQPPTGTAVVNTAAITPVKPPGQQTNASHTHLHHWVFLIDQQVNDYEEEQGGDGREQPCDHDCIQSEGTITAHLQAKNMGLEDVPKVYTGITSFVMTPHCALTAAAAAVSFSPPLFALISA